MEKHREIAIALGIDPDNLSLVPTNNLLKTIDLQTRTNSQLMRS